MTVSHASSGLVAVTAVLGLICVAPTAVTYGQDAGKLGLNVPEDPELYVPPAHFALVQHCPELPATPLSPEEYRNVTLNNKTVSKCAVRCVSVESVMKRWG